MRAGLFDMLSRVMQSAVVLNICCTVTSILPRIARLAILLVKEQKVVAKEKCAGFNGYDQHNSTARMGSIVDLTLFRQLVKIVFYFSGL